MSFASLESSEILAALTCSKEGKKCRQKWVQHYKHLENMETSCLFFFCTYKINIWMFSKIGAGPQNGW